MAIHKFENRCGHDHKGPVLPKPKLYTGIGNSSKDIEVFGMRFRDQSLDEVADALISDAGVCLDRKVYFVNAHCINVASEHKSYASILRTAPFVYADGLGISLAARIMGTRLENNVNGTDLFPILCKKAADAGIPLAFFGAAPGNASLCAKRMEKSYPGLHVVWSHHGYVEQENEPELIDQINRSGARILLIAKGVPKQELWIEQNASKLNVPVLMGVGALFDFYSGAVPRAPLVWRKMRMEWLFRLIMEPRRLFRRYIMGNPEFLLRAIKTRFTNAR